MSDKQEILNLNDRLDVLEVRRKASDNPPEIDWRLYAGPRRENNDQTVREAEAKYTKTCHAILDELGIPKTRSECTDADLARIDDPNKKLRNAYLSGASLAMLDELTIRQRIDLGVRFYGQYMLGLSQPDKTDEVAYRFWEGDVTAAMDNAKIPRYLRECTDEEQVFLTVLDVEREMDAANVNRLWSVNRVVDVPSDEQYARMLASVKDFAARHPLRIEPYQRRFTSLDPWPFDLATPIRNHASDEADVFLHLDPSASSDGWMTLRRTILRHDKHREESSEKPKFFVDTEMRRGVLPYLNLNPVQWSGPPKTMFCENMAREVMAKLRGDYDGNSVVFRPLTAHSLPSLRNGRDTSPFWSIPRILDGVFQSRPRLQRKQPIRWTSARQVGKSTFWDTLQWGFATSWGDEDWPRSPACGFYLAASYPELYERDKNVSYYGSGFYYTGVVSGYIDLAKQQLFPQYQGNSYDRANDSHRASRDSRGGKRHSRQSYPRP